MSDFCNSASKSCKNIVVNQQDKKYSSEDESMFDLQETSTPIKKPFQAKSWSHQKLSGLSPLTSTSKKKVIKDLLTGIDVYDSKPTLHKPLEIKFHSPKYSQPFYTSSFLETLTISDKVKQIKNFHLKLARSFHKLQRKSIYLAETGNPILLKHQTNGSVENETDLSMQDLQEQEIYVSRCGRQMKRKDYKQDESDSDEENKKKKLKSEATKPANIRNNLSENFIDSDEDNSKIKIKKEKEPQKVVKRTNLKSLSNAEIMSRSSLFAEKSKTPRAEKLFNALKQENNNRVKAEKEIEMFEKSLNVSNDDDEAEIKITSSRFPRTSERPVIPGEPDIGNFVKMRVIPPSAKNKGGGLEPIPSSSNSNMNRININGKGSIPKAKKTTTCPICNQSFLQKEIEEHASTCGLTSELEIENNLPMQESMQCNICEKMLLLNTDYEVHVKQCIENLKRN